MHSTPSDLVNLVALNKLERTRATIKSRIAESHGLWMGPNYLWSDNLSYQTLADNDQASAVPPVDLIAIPNVELKSDFMGHHLGQPVVMTNTFSADVAEMYANGGIEAFNFPLVNQIRTIDEAVFCVSYYNMQTYGHFLLEVLPKILMCRQLRGVGLRSRLAFPSDAYVVSNIVRQLCDPDEVVFYKSSEERLQIPIGIFPSVPVSESSHFHSWYAAAIWRFAAGVAHAEAQKKLPGPRLFLSRQHVTGFRTLTNEAEAFSVASDYGFELVHPQELPWFEQIAMFFGATHVMGADNSALHGAMFCPAGTNIISLGRIHNVQAALAAVFGHRIGYVMASSGTLGEWTPGGSRQFYEIDTVELRRRLDAVMRHPR